jgi:hypothetical protein
MTAQPTINSITDGGDQTLAIANVTASGTVQLYYRKRGAAIWTAGLTRTASGNITQTGLEPGWYEFYATDTIDGATSAPSNLITMQIADVPVVETSVNEFDQSAINASPEMITIMGEPVTFFPDGGGSRSILAIIDRGGQAALPGMRGNAPMTTIIVINDYTTGISSAEINVDCDKVSLALRRGKLPQQRIITKILYEDAGMLQLEVR